MNAIVMQGFYITIFDVTSIIYFFCLNTVVDHMTKLLSLKLTFTQSTTPSCVFGIQLTATDSHCLHQWQIFLEQCYADLISYVWTSLPCYYHHHKPLKTLNGPNHIYPCVLHVSTYCNNNHHQLFFCLFVCWQEDVLVGYDAYWTANLTHSEGFYNQNNTFCQNALR